VSASELLADPEVGLVAVATRHATHAHFARLALESGRPVFVEKPPCLTEEELEGLRLARDAAAKPLVVGFNRRHAPLALRLRGHVAGHNAPIEMLFRVSAGRLDPKHWLNDPDDGGGRLLGEGCHFIDFACWLVGSIPKQVSCSVPPSGDLPLQAAQHFSCTLTFSDGSLATITYGAEGANQLGKEYVEAHSAGHSAVLDDFRSLLLYTPRGRRRIRGRGQDKGHVGQLIRLREVVTSDATPPDGPDPLATMSVTLAALRSAQRERPVLTSPTPLRS
jgi:predicted dehydrogenase